MTDRWKLHNGDALVWLMGLADNSADAVIFDPPYSSGGRSASERKRKPSKKYLRDSTREYPEFHGDQRDQRGWLAWMTLVLLQCYRIARAGAPLCMFCDWRQAPTASDALQAGGFLWRGTVAWDKTEAARPARGRFRQQAEFIQWGSKGEMPSNRLDCAERQVLPGVVRQRVDPQDKFHTTGKPTQIMLELVRICEPGGLIVDPFAGSGTTGVAAVQLGYRFLGCESSTEYADIARGRLASVRGFGAATGQQLTLGETSHGDQT